jgi:competence transcription factor ComK
MNLRVLELGVSLQSLRNKMYQSALLLTKRLNNLVNLLRTLRLIAF